MVSNYIKVGVGVIILSEDKILLGHRVNNYHDTGGIYEPDSWTLPGGKQEYDETIIQCAKRETKEETNLDISDIFVFTAEDDISSNRHFVTIQCVAKSFAGKIKIMEPDKIDEWRWFKLSELPDNIYSPSKKGIKAYLERGM